MTSVRGDEQGNITTLIEEYLPKPATPRHYLPDAWGHYTCEYNHSMINTGNKILNAWAPHNPPPPPYSLKSWTTPKLTYLSYDGQT